MDSTGAVVLISALFIIIFGMGLTLTPADFARVVKYPKAVIVGLVNQLILLPIVGFSLAYFLKVDPTIAVGLMILAACPGGATSNLITHLAKGDTALSVSLTAIASLVTIFSIPLIISFSLDYFMGSSKAVELDLAKVFGQLLVIIVIPVSLGMLIRSKKESFAERMERPVKIASALVLALVIAGIFIKEKNNVASYFEQAGTIALSLNLLTMGLGFVSAVIFRLSSAQTVTISIESGIQNGTMAIGIATIALGSSAMAIPAAIYSLIMFGTGFAIILIGTNTSSKAKRSSPH